MSHDPGRYDKRMILWEPTLGIPSESGEQAVGSREVARMWCSLEPLQGREYLAAQQMQAETTHNVRTWYRSDVTPNSTMWFTFGSRRFDIESVIDADEAHEEFLFRVRETQPPAA